MSEVTVRRYRRDMSRQWDSFVARSINGTFLLTRPYMDYHSDRFSDHSLIAFNTEGAIISLLPASEEGETLISHPGLTYGGWIVGQSHCGPAVMLSLFDSLKRYMRDQSFRRLVYKPIPSVYHVYPCEDDIYALFRNGAMMTGCMVSSAFPVDRPLLMTGNNRRCSDRLLREGMRVSDLTDDCTLFEFWKLLDARLSEAHNTRPVHTFGELSLLHHRFPDNIRLLSIKNIHGEMIGGTIIYITPNVIHTQYIATNEEGRHRNCMTLIIRKLTEMTINARTIRYIDFGVSCENWGKILNEGLAAQKRNLGGRSNLYTRFEMTV